MAPKYIFSRSKNKIMHKIMHLRVNNKNADLCAIKNLYNDGKFQFIDENLNRVTKDFINSQLRNVDKIPCGRRWTIKDKALLYLYI